MVHVNSQKDELALKEISYTKHVNSLRYRKRLILYWMTLVLSKLSKSGQVFLNT